MNRDLFNNLKFVTNLVPANRTVTSTAGPATYTQGAESAVVMANVGAPGDTLSGSIYIEFEVQESVLGDGSDWAAAANASLYNPVSGATNTGTFAKIVANGAANKIYADGYIGTANYIRIVERRTGTHTTGTPTATSILLGNLDYRPASGNAT